MNEVWISLYKVIELGDYYEVSNLGNVRSVDRYIADKNGVKYFRKGILMKKITDGNGYFRVGLSKEGRTVVYSIHRLVALAFIPNSKGKPQVNHKDGNKGNNYVGNLEWNTNGENQQHAYDNGLKHTRKGKDSHRYGKKLTEETKRKISKKAMGRKPSDETRKKLSRSQRGRKHSEETKRKIGNVHKGEKNWNARRVVQLDLDGVFMAEYATTEDASRAVSGHRGNITACCKRKTKTSYGFKWMYKEDYQDLLDNNGLANE